MDDHKFLVTHGNSINAILGYLNAKPLDEDIESIIVCLNHLYAQNMMLYNELRRRENEELENTNCIVEERENGNR